MMALAIKQMTDDVHKALGQFELRLAALEKMVENVGEAVEQSTMETASRVKSVDSKVEALDGTLRDILRSVQLLRDKQVRGAAARSAGGGGRGLTGRRRDPFPVSSSARRSCTRPSRSWPRRR